jgi:hypothetical protein
MHVRLFKVIKAIVILLEIDICTLINRRSLRPYTTAKRQSSNPVCFALTSLIVRMYRETCKGRGIKRRPRSKQSLAMNISIDVSSTVVRSYADGHCSALCEFRALGGRSCRPYNTNQSTTTWMNNEFNSHGCLACPFVNRLTKLYNYEETDLGEPLQMQHYVKRIYA